MVYTILIIFVLFLFAASLLRNATKYSQRPPGPISLPIIGSILALGSKPHVNLSRWKKKYGNIISINFGSVRVIVVNDLDTIKNVFSLKELQRRPAYEIFHIARGKDPSGMLFSYGRTNEEQRAFVLKTLKNLGMGKNSIEGLITDELQGLFSILDQQSEIPIANKGIFELTAVSALWSLMTGEHGKVEDSDFMNVLNKISKVSRGLNLFTMYFPKFSKLFQNLSGWNDFVTGLTEMDECASKSIHKHKMEFNPDSEPKDLIEAYLQKIESTQDENSTFFGKAGDKNLQSVISDFLGAGTETVSSSLTWLLTVLIYYPKVQEKIHLEIDRVIGNNRLPTLNDRPMLPYMESVVFEVLRISAILPLGFPHSTSENVKIDEYVIPKGTVVLANVYDALHDSKRWNEPEEFKPERFLTEDGSAVDRNIARNVDVVFGHGKRMCPGEKLAKDELFIFIAGLCQRYRFIRDPLCNYDQKIETELGMSLLPRTYSLIVQKR